MFGKFRKMAASVAVFALVVLPAGADAAAITTLFNTGVDAAGAPLANYASELHYTLQSVPSGPTDVRIATSANGFPIPPWIADNTISAWIGPNSNSVLTSPPGTYDYRTTFSLAGLLAATASITGRWSTDNSGVDILLNGNSTGQTAAGFTSFYSFALNTGFIDDLDTLDFIVFNAPGAQSNPTGLRVELSGTAATNTAVPEPASMALLGTGLFGLALTRRKRA